MYDCASPTGRLAGATEARATHNVVPSVLLGGYARIPDEPVLEPLSGCQYLLALRENEGSLLT
jgi:hypothetical protein